MEKVRLNNGTEINKMEVDIMMQNLRWLSQVNVSVFNDLVNKCLNSEYKISKYSRDVLNRLLLITNLRCEVRSSVKNVVLCSITPTNNGYELKSPF